MPTASLPMYDFPGTVAAIDTFWNALADNLRRRGLTDVPDHLTHNRPVRALWEDDDLLISQCCGYDVIARYKDRLCPVATPWYAAKGCFGGNYCSLIVVHKDSPFEDVHHMAGTRAAINGPESHSGMSALRHLISQRHGQGDYFTQLEVSGSHINSLQLIRQGKVDVAAIDSVTLALLAAHNPEACKDIKVLGTTYAAPAPPYVVRVSMSADDVARVQQALLDTFDDPDLAQCRRDLLLERVTPASQDDYWLLEAFHDHALKRGFTMVGQGSANGIGA